MISWTVAATNILANLSGRGIGVLLSFVFVPIYLNALGTESYGLLGVQGIIGSVFGLFDLGVSATITRELAVRSANKELAAGIPDFVRSYEILYAGIACFIILGAYPTSILLSHSWLNPEYLPVGIVETAVVIMTVETAFRVLSGLYFGSLVGLQKQVLLNVVMTTCEIVRYVGTALVLVFISDSIVAFVVCQLAVSVTYTAIMFLQTWQSLPSGSCSSARFALETIRGTYKFALAMGGVSLSNILLTQIDKVVLSRLLSLENFGFYSIATKIPSAISGILMHPVLMAVNPRFSQLVFSEDKEKAVKFFHQSCQLITVGTVTCCAVAIFFSYDIMLLWTRNGEVAEHTGLLVRLVVASSLFFLFPAGPWILRYAYGRVTIATFWNVAASLALLPLFLLGNSLYGVVGAVAVMIPVYAVHCFALSSSTFSMFFRTEVRRWVIHDILLPVAGSGIGVAIIYWLSCRYVLPMMIWLGAALVAGLVLATLSSNLLRVVVIDRSRSYFRGQGWG